MRKLWLRLGMSIQITQAEEEIILAGDDDAAIVRTIRNIIAEGCYTPDGDSYVPSVCVEKFNRVYGTHYAENDVDFEM